MLANTLKQANLQVQQHHGDQKRSQRFLKEWSELQESVVLAVKCVQMYGVIYMTLYVYNVHRMFIVNDTREGGEKIRGSRRERGEGERRAGREVERQH